MTEGVLLSIVGGALGLVIARVGVRALISMYPTSLPRTSEVVVDPVVLLFTLGVATATGVLFGLAPIMHTRVQGLVTALKALVHGVNPLSQLTRIRSVASGPSMTLPRATSEPGSRAQMQLLLETPRCSASASAPSGLPPNRPLNRE